MKRSMVLRWCGVCIVGILAACSSTPRQGSGAPVRDAGSSQYRAPAASSTTTNKLPPPEASASSKHDKSNWVAVPWSDLPGLEEDNLYEAWNAWLQNCERPHPALARLCSDVRQLSIASADEQRQWMIGHLQPYRVEDNQGQSSGQLTGYYEPVLDASRLPTPNFSIPLYQVPLDLAQRKPWYTRYEIETLPAAQKALQNRTIAYIADPIDSLLIQVQGSARLRLTEPDGSNHMVRLMFAGTNGHEYRSVGRWLLDQGLVRDASWSGVKAWLAQNPQRQQELLAVNPRVVFFKEQAALDFDAANGPTGAQGVALTAGRSIAVDPQSIPLGTPVWLVSNGSQIKLQRLVFAQDTGSAILGAVRADFFTGSGADAAQLAGRLRQPLQLWVLWSK